MGLWPWACPSVYFSRLPACIVASFSVSNDCENCVIAIIGMSASTGDAVRKSLWWFVSVDRSVCVCDGCHVRPLACCYVIYLYSEDPYVMSLICRVSSIFSCLCAFFYILPPFYVPFCVRKKKMHNFMCLLEFECAKTLKAHIGQAIPWYVYSIYIVHVSTMPHETYRDWSVYIWCMWT